MWFGYLNRNYEERLNIAVGADNGFNGEDMGQPEFFETRRQQFAFKVDVPANFPKDRDLVWTLKANGVDAEGLRLAVAGVGDRSEHHLGQSRQPHRDRFRRAAQRAAARRRSAAAADRRGRQAA